VVIKAIIASFLLCSNCLPILQQPLHLLSPHAVAGPDDASSPRRVLFSPRFHTSSSVIYAAALTTKSMAIITSIVAVSL
jgi:hypothetical protein